jgi:hypothetical protein
LTPHPKVLVKNQRTATMHDHDMTRNIQGLAVVSQRNLPETAPSPQRLA